MWCKLPYEKFVVLAIKHAGGNGNLIINFSWPYTVHVHVLYGSNHYYELILQHRPYITDTCHQHLWVVTSNELFAEALNCSEWSSENFFQNFIYNFVLFFVMYLLLLLLQLVRFCCFATHVHYCCSQKIFFYLI